MKRIAIGALAVICLVLWTSMTPAAEYGGPDKGGKEEGSWRFKPTFSVGYAFSSDTEIAFRSVDGLGLLGARKIELDIPGFSGVYLAAELPYALTDRLKLTLAGRWAFSAADDGMGELYNDSTIIGRDWDSDSRDWVTVDLLLAYAFVKDYSFIRDVSAVVGFRWDHHQMGFDNAHNRVGVFSLPSDTIDFTMNTYSPVFGITTTFSGIKRGIFGGDIKLGVLGSPAGLGDIEYKETFGGGVNRIHFDSGLDRSYFYNVFGEITALSGKLSPGSEASLSLFLQFTEFFTSGKMTGTAEPVGIERDFNFEMNPNLAVVGLKASIAF